MTCYGGWRLDPGPCPVDDTPHTACTPESVALQASSRSRPILTIPLRRPRGLPRVPAAPAPVSNAPDVVETVTTKTYRGRKRKAAR